MGSVSRGYNTLEIMYALKVHTSAVLYCATKYLSYSLGYSFLKNSKDFIN